MRSILIAVLVIIVYPTSGYAQQVYEVSLVDAYAATPDLSLEDRLNTIDEPIPPILYDRVFPLAGLNNFNEAQSSSESGQIEDQGQRGLARTGNWSEAKGDHDRQHRRE